MKYIITLVASLAVNFVCFSQSIVRGPYLQVRTQNSIKVRYKTSDWSNSIVKVGTSPQNLNLTFSNPGWSLDHNVSITGLSPNTKYYYAIFNGTNLLQGTSDNYFITSQAPNSEQKIRIWATGDCGTGIATQTNVKNKFLDYVGNNYIDAWLLLGDNAYTFGLDEEYQAHFFNQYQNDRIMKQSNIYPVPGNHEYWHWERTDLKYTHDVAYFNIFSPVKLGEMGGVPSNNKRYYSYDIGNTHFVALDSYGVESSSTPYTFADTTETQIVWLKNDLASNQKKWTIVYFHHPPYTMGSHNSDTELDLVAIRQNLVPILERYNVDLVLTGHSHNYERSKLMKGHFGNELSFSPTQHLVSTSSGYYDGSNNSCPYHKKSDNSVKGTVYVVAGAAGKATAEQASFPHEALPFVEATMGGSVYIEVEGDRLDYKMIAEDGVIRDKFSMVKDLNQIRSVIVNPNSASIKLKSPYNEPAKWQATPLIAQEIDLHNPVSGMAFHVEDTKGCFKDTLVLQTNNPCVQSQMINNNVEVNSNINLKASQTITGQAVFPSETSTILDAKRSIELKPGFIAENGAFFVAKIGGC